MQGLCSEREREGGGTKKEEQRRQPREIRESVAIPAALQLGEFYVMHRESRLHASNGKRGKITLPFHGLNSRIHGACVYYFYLFVFIKQIDAVISCVCSKVYAVYLDTFVYSS